MKNLERMLKQMGIKARELKVKKVIFVLEDGKELVAVNPQVIETEAMGQRAYQVVGTFKEEISEEDVRIVMEKAGVDEEKAREALKKSGGDIAEAIIMLTESQ